MKYLGQAKCPLDEKTYKTAEEQLEIIHYSKIIHGEINLRNILFSEGKAKSIDFRYSNYDGYHDSKGKCSRLGSANEEEKSEHREFCELYGHPRPKKYRN